MSSHSRLFVTSHNESGRYCGYAILARLPIAADQAILHGLSQPDPTSPLSAVKCSRSKTSSTLVSRFV